MPPLALTSPGQLMMMGILQAPVCMIFGSLSRLEPKGKNLGQLLYKKRTNGHSKALEVMGIFSVSPSNR